MRCGRHVRAEDDSPRPSTPAPSYQPAATSWRPRPSPASRPRRVTRPRCSSRRTRTSTDYVARWLQEPPARRLDQIYRGGLRIETTLDPPSRSRPRRHVPSSSRARTPTCARRSCRRARSAVRAGLRVRPRLTPPTSVNYALGADGRRLGPPAGLVVQALRAGPAPSRPGLTPEHALLPAAPTTSPSPAGRAPTASPRSSRTTRGAATARCRCATPPGRRSTPCSHRLILDVGVHETMDLARSMGLKSVRRVRAGKHCASVALGAESGRTARHGVGLRRVRGPRRARASPPRAPACSTATAR
jgi:hypothetical protein